MKELYFKVLIAEKIDIPLSTAEMAQNPTFEMYWVQYHEKLINIMYHPANGLNEKKFIKLVTRKLILKFKTMNVEHLEKQKSLQFQE